MMASLKPPFSPDASLTFEDTCDPKTTVNADKIQLIFPAAYHTRREGFQELNPEDPAIFKRYLDHEVDVKRLNGIHDYLWLAGLPRPARALSQQLMLGRAIVFTGDADLHLAWDNARVFIKPLPEFLLCHAIWEKHLSKDKELYEAAAGLLLSYLWLVPTKLDLKIAQEQSLLPNMISWQQWVRVSRATLQNLDFLKFQNINARYRYGELRLGRLNWIYSFGSREEKFTSFIRGYSFLYPGYSSFFQRNTQWLVGVLGYILLVLTAMQVGLATDRLGHNLAFQNASYGFTAFSIFAPLIVLGLLVCYMALMVLFNALYTWKKRRDERSGYLHTRKDSQS
jgi:hypothetical protein